MNRDRAIGRACHLLGGGALDNLDPLAAQFLKRDSRQFRVVLAQRLRAFDNGHLRPQPPMRLRHLHTDRASANDDQVIGSLHQIKDRLVGVDRYIIKAWDWWHKRRRACGDNKPAGGDDRIPGLHLFVRNELAELADHVDAEPFEPFLAVHRLDGFDDAVHMTFRRGIVDDGLHRGHAEVGPVPHQMRLLARRDQGLRRHAAEVQAIAAHLVTLEQDHIGPHLRRAGGDRQSARACTDDADIRLDPVHGL